MGYSVHGDSDMDYDTQSKFPCARSAARVNASRASALAAGTSGVPESDEAAVRLVHAAIDAGITFLDNAWDYNDGLSEERMGKAIADRRDQVFLMTKVCTHGRDAKVAMRQLEDSLRRLQTDYLDLWQIHEFVFDDEPAKHFARGGVVEALDARAQQGKVRYVGFTGHKDPALHLAMLAHDFPWDACQLPLNCFDASFRSFEQQVLPELNRRGIAPIGMKSLGGDARAVKAKVVVAEEALRYAMSLPVATVVSGIDSMRVLQQNVAVARGFKPMTARARQALSRRVARPRRRRPLRAVQDLRRVRRGRDEARARFAETVGAAGVRAPSDRSEHTERADGHFHDAHDDTKHTMQVSSRARHRVHPCHRCSLVSSAVTCSLMRIASTLSGFDLRSGVAQQHDRIDLERAPRRNPRGDGAHHDDHHHGHQERVERRIPDAAGATAGPHDPRQPEHQQQPEGRSGRDQPNGVRRDERDDVAAGRAHGDTDRQLARPPRDRKRQHAVDPRHRQQDPDRDQREERRGRDQHLLGPDVDHLIDGLHAADDDSGRDLAHIVANRLARALPDRPSLAREKSSG